MQQVCSVPARRGQYNIFGSFDATEDFEAIEMAPLSKVGQTELAAETIEDNMADAFELLAKYQSAKNTGGILIPEDQYEAIIALGWIIGLWDDETPLKFKDACTLLNLKAEIIQDQVEAIFAEEINELRRNNRAYEHHIQCGVFFLH